MDAERMEFHVKIVAWLFIAFSLVFVLVALLALALFGGIGLASGDPEALPILGTIGLVSTGLLGSLAAPGLLAGWGLLSRRGWARILGIVGAVLYAFEFPVGTVFAIYVLWVLTAEETGPWFEPASGPAEAAG